MIVLLTGATGKVASYTIPFLAKKGVTVRGLVRDRAKAKALADQGVELVEGDLDRPRSLSRAFEGVDVAFVIAPPSALAPAQCSNALWAARNAGVKRVVRLSAWGAAHDAPNLNSRMHALSDAELERSNIPFTILKPHYFMQNLMMIAASAVKDGRISLALGEGHLAMIDAHDIGEVAAHVLTTDGHEGKSYRLTGPASITMHDVAAAFGEVLGKPVTYVPMPIEQADEMMAKMGVNDFSRTAMIDYFGSYARDWAPITTDDVPRLLGHPARSIATFARDALKRS
jgi:uncharacterized protein YbjT (DUF2867 family)